MANADQNNVTKRSSKNRPLTFAEGDQNLDELINVIDDQQNFETEQGTTNTALRNDVDSVEADVNGTGGVTDRVDVLENDLPKSAYGIIDIAVSNSNVTVGTNDAKTNGLRLVGTLTADVSVIVPNDKREWTIVNDSSGNFDIVVKTSAGSGVVVPQGQTFFVRCDGADVVRGVDSQRTIYVGSVAELEALPKAGFVDGQMFDVRGGKFQYVSATSSFEPVTPIPIDAFGAVVGDGTANDYATFDLAGAWLEIAPYRRVTLTPGKTYFLSYTGNLFFNGIDGRGSSVIIDAGGFLGHVRTTPTDEFYLENVNIYKVGDRSGPATTGTGEKLYPETYLSPTEKSHIKNVKAYGITSASDLGSWADDAGETRFGRFLNVLSKDSHAENVSFYGIGLGLRIGGVESARHTEIDVHGYNCETNVWIAEDGITEFEYGRSENLSIINSPTQATYWIGRDTGTLKNGKNVLLKQPEHVESWVSNIKDKNAIERVVYLSGGNNTAIGLTGVNNSTGGNFKRSVTSISDANMRENNSLAGSRILTSLSAGEAVHAFYGQRNLTLSDMWIKGKTKLAAPAFIFQYGIDGCALSSVYAENLGVFMGHVPGQSIPVKDLTVSDVTLKNVYNGLSNNGTVVDLISPNYENLSIENVTHEVDSPASGLFARSAYSIDGVSGLKLRNVQGWGNRYAFLTPNCTDVEVLDSEFFIASDVALGTALASLKAASDFEANRFDFTVSIPVNASPVPAGIKIRFQSDYSGSKRACWDNWTEIDIVINPPANTSFQITLPIFDKSWDLSASYLDSSLVLSGDAEAGTSTVVRSRGSDLSHTDFATKYRVYTGGTDLAVRTDSTSLPGGQINIKVRR